MGHGVWVTEHGAGGLAKRCVFVTSGFVKFLCGDFLNCTPWAGLS